MKGIAAPAAKPGARNMLGIVFLHATHIQSGLTSGSAFVAFRSNSRLRARGTMTLPARPQALSCLCEDMEHTWISLLAIQEAREVYFKSGSGLDLCFASLEFTQHDG